MVTKKNAHGDSDIYPVILAGGSGSRFWPLSRESSPKQLLKIVGDKTMIQHTVDRASILAGIENILIVAGKGHQTDIKTQLGMHKTKKKIPRVLVEPASKNTAPALIFAALYLNKIDPNSLMVVMPADHYIKDNLKFSKAVAEAVSVAKLGYLVTMGIKPSRPETGYGYIHVDKHFENKKIYPNSYLVKRFVEKPDLEGALSFLDSDEYFWNSGIFVWKTSSFIKEIKKHLPATYKKMMIAEEFLGTPKERQILEKIYDTVDSISVDYAVLEKCKQIAMVTTDMNWSDVGTWSAVYDVAEKDNHGNVTTGSTVTRSTYNSLIYGNDRLIATVGVKDLIIVDTEDATLVCNKDSVQEVRKVYEELKLTGHEAHREHKTTQRPWGFYTILKKGRGYKVKIIMIMPGEKISLQLHQKRSEHWIVVEGIATITIGDETFELTPNKGTYVPIDTKHCLRNLQDIPLSIIEVQCGEKVVEEDIIRFDDDYDRLGLE